MTIFETERLIVRSLSASDAGNYFSIHGDAEIMQFIRPAKSREETDQMLLEHIEYNKTIEPLGRWMVETKASREFTGTFVLFPINNSDLMQIGYSLLKKFWGKGYASELTKAGIDYFFQYTGREELYAIVESGNIASEKVLLKNGFVVDQHLEENEKLLTRFRIQRSAD